VNSQYQERGDSLVQEAEAKLRYWASCIYSIHYIMEDSLVQEAEAKLRYWPYEATVYRIEEGFPSQGG
jgi:hypothetical protein